VTPTKKKNRQQTVPVIDEQTGEELEIDRDVDIFKDMWPQLVGSYSDSSPVAFPPGILFICIFIYMYAHNLYIRYIYYMHINIYVCTYFLTMGVCIFKGYVAATRGVLL